MCGIVGIWNVRHPRPLAAVESMLDAIKHRGPDGQGTLAYEGGAAGMARLALVDLSDRGLQPIWSDDRRVAILYNGEVYNFRDERDRLEKSGFRFRTTTDTEVVLNLYIERGIRFTERLRGMYALAIFDWRNTAPGLLPELVLARGPLGIKHLYLAHPNGDPNQVVFSSEIRGMLASGLVAPEVSREALAGYLAHGFVTQPSTMISGVRMLEPGTVERYAPNEAMRSVRFWQMPPYKPRSETLDAAAERLRGVLDESVRIHAMADAPIGAFLSGGVDSTGVVALMRKHVADLRTYTLRFPDLHSNDEVEQARAAAASYDCRHTVVDVTSKDVCAALPRFAGELDQPSNDGLNTWLVSRAAAREVKGVLSGLGGDEWFAGYPVTRRMARYANSASGRALAVAGQLAYAVSPWLPAGRVRDRAENLATRRSALATWAQTHSVFRYEAARRAVGLEADRVEQTTLLCEVLDREEHSWRQETPIGLSCLLDTRVYMIGQLLRDSDASSMAHSLELRVPLVDQRIAEFSRTCLDRYKLDTDGGTSNQYGGSGAKRVLIHALRDVLPPSIFSRPKMGFVLPYQAWMRGEAASLVAETCGDESVGRRGLIDPEFAESMVRAAKAGKPGAAYPSLWTLMILELWCRAVIDKYQKPAVASRAVGV
jgi:asparagine synthase (glutamine-hydrolysing)